MNGLIIIGYVLVVILFILFLKYYNKYRSLYKSCNVLVTELNSKKILRNGHYKEVFSQTFKDINKIISYEGIYYVSELDCYTNGESLIRLDNIKIVSTESGLNYDNAMKFIKNNFKEIKNTNEVTWLESKNKLSDNRKKKLEELKERIKK